MCSVLRWFALKAMQASTRWGVLGHPLSVATLYWAGTTQALPAAL